MRSSRVSFEAFLPVQLDGVPRYDAQSLDSAFRIPHSALMRQSAIFFYGDHGSHARREDLRQAPLPRPDFDHDVFGRGLERIHNALQDVPVGEEVLAEPLVRTHTLRMTTVRSSAGGAPPVKPARAAGTDSRISRAGRARKPATWPSTRSLPNPPPRGPNAPGAPPVK